jgi:pimeloyl-ACP methyl ester carboxylesterase
MTVRRLVRRLAVGAVAVGAATALGVAVERRAIRRARSKPDPAQGEDLGARPGPERRVRSFDGTELAVHAIGREHAPTVVFVHGFSSDLTFWHFQWQALSPRYRCVVYDQRGHGRSSPATTGDYSLRAFGEDLAAVLDAIAPEGPVALVGHSMGGMAVMAFADAHPEAFGERVRAVVFANTAAAELARGVAGALGERAGRALSMALVRLARDPRLAFRIRARALRGGDLAFLAARLTNFGADAPPSVVEHAAAVGATAPLEVWSEVLVGLIEMDLRHALANVRAPALVLVGDVDRLTPPTSATALRSALPDAELRVVEGSGHCTMLERPDEFNAIVGAFLEQHLPAERIAKARR